MTDEEMKKIYLSIAREYQNTRRATLTDAIRASRQQFVAEIRATGYDYYKAMVDALAVQRMLLAEYKV